MNAPANDTIERISLEVSACQLCALGRTRTKAVPGVGNPSPTLMFVGEGPGRDEDLQGEPFVGAAGQLLTRMLAAIDLQREEVYITNVVKCRPPGNRTPLPDEVGACREYLERQLAVLRPKIICALGSVAVRALLDTAEGITKIHGRWFSYRGIPLLPTFHPAYLLRNQGMKRAAWEDLKMLRAAHDRALEGKRPVEGRTEAPPPPRGMIQLTLDGSADR